MPTLAVFLLVSAILAYGVTIRLIGQVHYRYAQQDFLSGNEYPAIQQLLTALRYQPMDQAIHKLLGQCYQKASNGANQTQIAWALAQRSKSHLRTAFRLNALDPETAYGLALTESRLKQLFTHIFPTRKHNPFNPLPYFQEAIRLYPACYAYLLALARYQHRNNQPEQLEDIIQSLARIYPPGVRNLTRELFWSPSAEIAVKKGLQEAIDTDISPRIAHQELAILLDKGKDLAGAILHYRQALSLPTKRNTPVEYFHLGRLYLKNGQSGEAEYCFFKGLDISPDRDRQISDLLRDYQQVDSSALLHFYDQVKLRYPISTTVELALIRSLFELKHFNQAQDMLDSLTLRDPRADVYYWHSRIAEIRKDWDRMELSIQKATVLDPNNPTYLRLFINLLKKMGKWETAEQTLNRLIESLNPPQHALFEERAQMRFNRKDYAGAVDDWKESLRVKPDRHDPMARIAESFVQLGDLKQAIVYFRQAAGLAPDNAGYRQKIVRLEAGK